MMKRVIFLGTIIVVMALATAALATDGPADAVDRVRDRVTDCVPPDLVTDESRPPDGRPTNGRLEQLVETNPQGR